MQHKHRLFDVNVPPLQAIVDNVREGIQKEAYPKNLTDFLSWVNRFGDHFAGDRTARNGLIQDSSSLAQLYKMLEQEQKALKKHFQVCTSCDSAFSNSYENSLKSCLILQC
jgi:hypothetical protein